MITSFLQNYTTIKGPFQTFYSLKRSIAREDPLNEGCLFDFSDGAVAPFRGCHDIVSTHRLGGDNHVSGLVGTDPEISACGDVGSTVLVGAVHAPLNRVSSGVQRGDGASVWPTWSISIFVTGTMVPVVKATQAAKGEAENVSHLCRK